MDASTAGYLRSAIEGPFKKSKHDVLDTGLLAERLSRALRVSALR